MNILLANLTKMVNDSGGLAKVTSTFATEMVARGHTVSIMYSDERDGDFYYPVPSSVALYDVRKLDTHRQGYPLWYRIKRELYRLTSKEKARTINNEFAEQYLKIPVQQVLEQVAPDVIVSFQPAATKLLLLDVKTDIPIVTMSHGDPADYFKFYPKLELPAIEKCAMNQVLLPSFEDHLKAGLENAKTIVIGNAIPQFTEIAPIGEDKEVYTIGFLGRLSKNHKQPHIVIEAFAKLAKAYPQWQLKLWGSQENKAYYKHLHWMVKQYSLTHRVHFMGQTKDAKQALLGCDIFAFPSAYEGFGLAMGEAMSLGVPPIGFASCSAVNELIIHEENGLLANDGVEGFTEALERLMAHKNLRVQYGIAAKENMRAYAPEHIWEQWEKLLENIYESK